MVHRDLKPENILFSPGREQFVLGDFGMAELLKEDYRQDTLTRFVGTPNYCSPQMAQLLSGGTGYVNLYLNDLHSLQQTLSHFSHNLLSCNSCISSNSMSFNDQYEQHSPFYGSSSFGAESEDSSSSNPPHSLGSYHTPTVNSLAALSTTNSLAPKEDASLINHFSSTIIYQICRTMERQTEVPRSIIATLVTEKYPQHENQDINSALIFEIEGLTQLFLNGERAENLIREWRTSSRHYGPQKQQTLELFEKVRKAVDGEGSQKMISIDQQLWRADPNLKEDKVEIELSKQLNNIPMFYAAFLSYLRGTLRNEDRTSMRLSDIAVNYIYCLSKIG